MSSEAPPQNSKLVKTALAAIDGYNKWNIDLILAPRAPDCLHYVLPKSLGRPGRSNEDYKHYFGAIMPYFKDFHLTILDITEDQARNQVVIHASSTASTTIGPYKNEYMLTFFMTEDQEKVVKIEEFVDSALGTDFFSRLFGAETMGKTGQEMEDAISKS